MPDAKERAGSCPVCGGTSLVRTRSRRRDPFVAVDSGRTRSTWKVCRACGLVHQNPRAVSAGALYGESGYEDAKRRSASRDHDIDAMLRDRLDKPLGHMAWIDGASARLGVHVRPGHVLDVGCGVGGALRRFGDLGWDALGFEPDPVLCAIGRDRLGVRIVNDFFGELPRSTELVASCSVDLVYTSHSFEHFDDLAATTRAIRRVVGPGGLLFIAVPTFRRATQHAVQTMHAAHNYLFSHRTLSWLLHTGGFVTVAHEYRPDTNELYLLATPREAADDASGDAQPQGDLWWAVWAEVTALPVAGWMRYARRAARMYGRDRTEFRRRLVRKARTLASTGPQKGRRHGHR